MAPLSLLLLLLLLLSTPSTLASSSSSSSSSSLDPKQLTALESMNIPTTPDPCSSSRSNLTLCDSSTPFRHLISLSLLNCSSDLDQLPSTALRSLSTLTSLSFTNCPRLLIKHPLPTSLSSSLRSFSSLSSLKRLSGVFLSRLRNLTSLQLASVPISASGPFVFLSQMPHLRDATVTGCNLTGKIPHHWRSRNLTHFDFSGNLLKGPLPSSINVLESLVSLNLSSNALTGTLPDTLGDLIFLKNLSVSRNSISGTLPTSMKEMAELTHLDLSINQLNGSVPRFLEEMKSLKYLNLEENSFQGVLPFNGSFLKRLDLFKIGGNGNLCYNKSLISSKLKLGIAPCDKYGLPISPPPDKSDSSDDGGGGYDDGGDDNDDGGSGKSNGYGVRHHGGPNKLVLGVAIGLSCLVFLVIFLVCISKCCN